MITIRQQVALKVGVNQVPAQIISFHGFESGKEHIAMQFTRDNKNSGPSLVRVHSECLTGDIFHSSRCDCGEQLDEAIKLLDETGGVLLYMRQEGRGIGLYNKLDAYAFQDAGLNTYEANLKLGFKEDHRDFSEAALMLKALEINEVTLITNNPLKIHQLQQNGIEVKSVVNTSTHSKPDNLAYLRAKKEHGKHEITADLSIIDIKPSR
ncbi:hypothetical protein LCGC14_0507680 [marine sediment metagenome]|uniref:GTP cyclohydrolase II n=1 Tax=marine sediment metagenome TaxID=412755 RepID=A0A0F9S737_9ZZZZ|nr:GTP cyclohydrolase II [Methylophaga sp.]HEC59297.1 GTP cyclohydrolase II [Methylophaga sp.]